MKFLLRIFSFLFLAACCLRLSRGVAEEKKGDPTVEAWKGLEGKWMKQTCIYKGVVGDLAKNEIQLLIAQDKVLTFQKGKLVREDVVVWAVIDPSKSPAHIDWFTKPKMLKETVIRGIYEAKGDRLRIVFSALDHSKRPEKIEFFKDDPLEPYATEYIRVKEEKK